MYFALCSKIEEIFSNSMKFLTSMGIYSPHLIYSQISTGLHARIFNFFARETEAETDRLPDPNTGFQIQGRGAARAQGRDNRQLPNKITEVWLGGQVLQLLVSLCEFSLLN